MCVVCGSFAVMIEKMEQSGLRTDWGTIWRKEKEEDTLDNLALSFSIHKFTTLQSGTLARARRQFKDKKPEG